MNELRGTSDADINTYLMIREMVCECVCGRGRKCMNMECVEKMLRLAGEINRVATDELPD